MKKSKLGDLTHGSKEEHDARSQFLALFKDSPIPDEELMSNLGLFLNSKSLARILCMHHIYQQIVPVPGVVMEFGVRWGQNLSLFAALRGIYDTFNRHRKIIGFDSFEGFPSVDKKDGKGNLISKGNLAVPKGYDNYLKKILTCQEKDNPLAHIERYELVKGDACETFEQYLARNPETIVALAYFDFDIYAPTKKCLELILPRLVKGSVVGFDELNDHDAPGETLAVMETLGLNKIRLQRFPYASRVSYFVFE